MGLDKMTHHRNSFFPFSIISKNYPALMVFINYRTIGTVLY